MTWINGRSVNPIMIEGILQQAQGVVRLWVAEWAAQKDLKVKTFIEQCPRINEAIQKLDFALREVQGFAANEELGGVTVPATGASDSGPTPTCTDAPETTDTPNKNKTQEPTRQARADTRKPHGKAASSDCGGTQHPPETSLPSKRWWMTD